MNKRIHTHPISGQIIYGDRLKVGDKIQGTDVFASTAGKWENAPCSAILQENETLWVRPLPLPRPRRVRNGFTLTDFLICFILASIFIMLVAHEANEGKKRTMALREIRAQHPEAELVISMTSDKIRRHNIVVVRNTDNSANAYVLDAISK